MGGKLALEFSLSLKNIFIAKVPGIMHLSHTMLNFHALKMHMEGYKHFITTIIFPAGIDSLFAYIQ